MNTGVMGGESQRDQSGLARISVCTSVSQPSLTPSTFSKAKKQSLIGVCRVPLADGGLLMELPDDDKGGVEGKEYSSALMKRVSIGIKAGEPCCTKMAGFICEGCGEAIGVMLMAAPRKALVVAIWCMFMTGWAE